MTPGRVSATLAAVSAAVIVTLFVALYLVVDLSTNIAGALRLVNLVIVGPLVGSVAAIGFLSMCLLQTIRLLVPVRGLFHERAVRRWLQVSKGEGEPLDDLLNLTGRNSRIELFDLPTEQLCGQIGAASDAALAMPSDHRALLTSLAGSAGEDAVTALFERPDQGTNPFGPGSLGNGGDVSADKRNAVSYHIQRNIDALQITASAAWRRRIRITTILLCATIAFTCSLAVERYEVSLHPKNTSTPSLLGLVLASLMVGIAAAFVASILRDLAAVVEKMRRG